METGRIERVRDSTQHEETCCILEKTLHVCCTVPKRKNLVSRDYGTTSLDSLCEI